jgi:hypothetical protein
MAPREPLSLKSGYIKSLNQEINKNLIKSKNVFVVNLIYLVILPSIATAGLIIYWLGHRMVVNPT